MVYGCLLPWAERQTSHMGVKEVLRTLSAPKQHYRGAQEGVNYVGDLSGGKKGHRSSSEILLSSYH